VVYALQLRLKPEFGLARLPTEAVYQGMQNDQTIDAFGAPARQANDQSNDAHGQNFITKKNPQSILGLDGATLSR
jgi:hypothetical protein